MPEIKRVSLTSSHLKAAGYDAEAQTLFVEFANGQTYAYENVPLEVYNGLISAESPGKFHALNLKGIFSYEVIEMESEMPDEPTIEQRLTKLEAEFKAFTLSMTGDG